MNENPELPDNPIESGRVDPVLEVTRYERVVSALVAVLLVLAPVTLLFSGVWLAAHGDFRPQEPIAMELREYEPDGGGDPTGVENSDPLGRDGDVWRAIEVSIETPTADDQAVVEFTRQLGGLVRICEELAVAADLAVVETAAGRPTGRSRVPILGDGPGRDGGVHLTNRIELVFDMSQTEAEYARQLDFFHVELGVIVGGELFMTSNLTSSTPNVRKATEADRKRPYWSWRDAARRRADSNLVRLAKGLEFSEGAIVLQFYADEMIARLRQRERDYATARGVDKLDQVRKTRIAVRKSDDGYDFEVIKQDYLPAAKRA